MPRESMKNEIDERLKRFQERLAGRGVDGAILVQKTDLYYLSGTDQDAHLWVPAHGTSLLMVRKSLERAREDSLLEEIVPLSGLSRVPELIRKHTKKIPKRLGLELDILPSRLYMSYQRLLPDTEMVDISSLIRGVRMVKSEYEVSCITKAAGMADSMYEKVPGFLAESKTETDLALRLEAFYRGKGHPGLVRTRTFNMECLYGHVMAGKSGAVASNSPGPTGGKGLGPFYSQSAGKDKIGKHEPVFVDYAANVEGYIADQARIFSLGNLPEKFHRAHNVMLEVQERLTEKGRPGARSGDLYSLALKIAEKAGLEEGFMGYPDPVPFVAHGVGLEIDEWPVIGRNSDTILEEGMVMALEPKFIFPGQGVVGIENTWVVTEQGMKKLNRFPDGIFEC
ncbi:MAG: aminopeptidase P family protein [Deltaproteobacteria bacterium]|nr:aminopeptidase P family protein [Deltaproteobacteria bacterium]MBW2119259.1 aminopeptidase P family protein [Deltaproteobacteria bacterium]MBW2345462.1 aminopeptidase P family protein [Deltaproteobacteria bacterium]